MPDNTYRMLIDLSEVSSGSLLSDMTPPIVPSKEIVDPEDKKPESWDEREKIQDESAVKPDDWDENEPEKILDTEATMPEGWLENEPDMVADPEAVKPDDWDDDTDGKYHHIT
jgi:calnexin